MTTLSHLISSHALFPVNTYLPVSPYYAGLEIGDIGDAIADGPALYGR